MSLGVLAITGLIAGLLIGMNPVLISSFTAYISAMIGRRTTNARYTTAGLLFIGYFVLFILFFSAGFASFISYLQLSDQLGIALAISLISIGFGLANIRRYFYKEPLVKPPKNVTDAIHERSTKKRGLVNLMALSMVVVYATLPSIGMAVAVMAVLGALLGPSSLVWGVPFIFGLITPIYIILALLSDKTRPSAIMAWKEKSKPIMRLYGGLTLVALAWLLLYVIAGGEIV